MNLLIDIGNSRVKWGTGTGRNIISGHAFLHQNYLDQNGLLDTWQRLKKPKKIAISSVTSAAIATRISALAEQLWPGVDVVRPCAQDYAYGVQNCYQNPGQLGIDRWLCLLALNQHYALPACVVDCGTAMTVDFLDNQGVHLGGLITPGLSLMKKSLHQETESLPFDQQTFSVGLADNTGAAIYNGTLLSAAGLIEYIMARQSMKFKLILTGGDAELIAHHISLDTEIEPDLVLQGLSVILEN